MWILLATKLVNFQGFLLFFSTMLLERIIFRERFMLATHDARISGTGG